MRASREATPAVRLAVKPARPVFRPGAGARLQRLALPLVLAAALFHVGTAAVPDVFDELPGQYASTAWEMVESGDWLIPTLGGVPRLQKPPLAYWIIAASLALLGRNEFAARLPTALALAGLVLATRALGTRLGGPARGAAAAGVLATSLGTVALGKLIMPEPFLALGIALTLLAVVRCVEDPERGPRWALAAWGVAALATLTKGLHGWLLPTVIVVLLALLEGGSRPRLRALLRPAGPALFVALVLPWPLYVESQFPGYLGENLLNEQLGHLTDTHFPRDSEPTPLLLLWGQHLLWWFPWVLFAGAAAWARPRSARHPLGALPAVWLVTTAIAASLSGQRQDYHTMFAWPAFALLLGRAWQTDGDRRGGRWALGLPLLALLALGGLGLALWAVGGAEPPGAPAQSAPFGARNSVVGVLSGVAGAEWRKLAPLLLPAAAGLLLGAAGGLALHRRRDTRPWSWMPVAAGSLGLLVAAVAGLQLFAPLFSLRAVAAAVEEAGAPSGIVVYDGPSHRGSSLTFYTRVPVRWLASPDAEFAVRSRGVGRDRFVTREEVVARWPGREPTWLVTEESRLGAWRARLGAEGAPVLARSGTRVLLGSGAARARSPARGDPHAASPAR